MKKLLSIALGILLLASCTNTQKNKYQITGKINGKVAAKAYLQLYESGEMTIIDSANFVNGTFKFKGSLSSPDYYYIQIGESQNRISFFVENSKITITAHADSLQHAKITGSKTNNDYNAFNESKTVFDNKLNAIYNDYKKAETDELKTKIEIKYDSIDNLKAEYTKNYIVNNNSSMLAPFIIQRELVYKIDLQELLALTDTLNPELIENKYTKKLYKRIELLRNLQPGKPAVVFTQNDTAGNPISLSDFKGKYLLIDFWASWCVPCRKANPTVVAMFNKYSAKGFTILSVSMDDNKEKWIKAIETDGLTWSHVSTLNGWKNPVGKLYAVNSIPHTILIDPDGNIVKRGLHAEELDGLLGSLLK